MKAFRSNLMTALGTALIVMGVIGEGSRIVGGAAQWAEQTIAMNSCDIYSKWDYDAKECVLQERWR